MRYTVEQFCQDAGRLLASKPNAEGREAVRQCLERLLRDEAFLTEHCSPSAKPGIQTIYRDPDTDFNLLIHVYEAGKSGPPHDHGTSWAIYGQAVGHTIMTTWSRLDRGESEGQANLQKKDTFRLDPGMAGTFEPGTIHSIEISDGSRFARVTGTDLNGIETLVFNIETGTVKSGNRL